MTVNYYESSFENLHRLVKDEQQQTEPNRLATPIAAFYSSRPGWQIIPSFVASQMVQDRSYSCQTSARIPISSFVLDICSNFTVRPRQFGRVKIIVRVLVWSSKEPRYFGGTNHSAKQIVTR